ncbi:MAG: hypothetical protein ACON3Z_03380 [Bradymonadia bacterium]
MKGALILAILTVLAFAVYLFSSASQRVERKRLVTKATAVSTSPDTYARRIASERIEKAQKDAPIQASTRTKAAAMLAGESVEKDEPKGPFEISLGQHKVHFRADPGFVLKCKLSVIVDSAQTRKEVLLSRRKLTRMLYFLGSSRRVEGTRGPAGRDRFLRDLTQRFSNVIRSGPIRQVKMDQYEVVEVAQADED